MDGYIKLPSMCWKFQLGLRTWLLLGVVILSGCVTPLPKLNANQECLHEDFENRVSAAGQCLVLDIYKSPKANNEPVLVVFVHGDGLGNRGYRYIQRFQDRIKDASSRNLIFVALTRPGYQNGREASTGDHHYYTGPAWVAHRGFSNWPTEKSISPHKFTANVSPAVEVVAVSGSADTNAISKFSADYVDLMKRDGKNARHVDLDGATHNGILRDERLWTMLNDMLRKLE